MFRTIAAIALALGVALVAAPSARADTVPVHSWPQIAGLYGRPDW